MADSNLERILAARAAGSRCILLAEDNPADVYLIREALLEHSKNSDVELYVVTDGEEAIDYVLHRGRYANACRPDLIVLDLNLPKSDGVDVLRCIREQSDWTTLPVVVLTSSDSPNDRSVTEKLGANSFITKPSDLDSFMALGGTLLSYANAGRAASGISF
jgi:CheY-like chemotaxis protein